MAAILKVTSYQKMTQSVNSYLLEEQFCQILFRADLKPWCLRLFLEEVAPTIRRTTTTRWI